MTKPDLLLLTPEFPPMHGGIARYLGALSEHFASRIRVVDPPLFRHLWPAWFKTVFMLMRTRSSYRYVIVSHVLPYGTAAMIARFFTKKPFVVIVHGMDVRLGFSHTRKRRLMRRVLQRAYLVVANSRALAHELQETFGLQNILTMYPCVVPVSLSSVLKSSTQIFRLLTVSRLVDRKGHDRVLNALAMLKLNGDLISFHYDIIGDGPTRDMLEGMVEELELSSYVTFHREVDDATLALFYAQADVFVMPVKDDPLDKEGFGLVFLEAAQYGVPSISTHVSGVNEAIVDQQTGLLVQDGDIEALAGAIRLLARDVAYRKILGTAAQIRVSQEFLCDQQFAKLDPYLV